MSGPAKHILEKMLQNSKTRKYSEPLRSFAMTLPFYSRRAYNFVRKTFNNCLPHIETISRWYTSVNGSPGFTEQALAALKQKARNNEKTYLCNLVIDEMSIRQQVEWTGSKFTGYIDIGADFDSDMLPEAREAIVLCWSALVTPGKYQLVIF